MSQAFSASESSRSRTSHVLLSVLIGTLAMGLWSGCDDNVSCVFTTGCQDDDTGLGPLASNSAVLPFDGQFIQTGPPRVDATFPSGDVAGTTPIVVMFSESMNEDSLIGTIEVSSPFGGPVVTTQELVAEGRVLLVFPSLPLDADDYVVSLVTTAVVTDLTGQDLSVSADLTNFTVVDPAPTGPALVTTFPRAGESNVSQTGELIFVFDRPLNTGTVTTATIDVTVGGSDPVFDPVATAVTTDVGTDARAFRYQSADPDGIPEPFGTDLDVQVAFSSALADLSGETLSATTINFQTSAFSAPLSAGLMSDPPDAIGIANLTPGADELMVQVDLLDGEEGDTVDLIFFGTDPDPMADPSILAFLRSVQITGTAPITTAMFDLAQVDFTTGNSADTARVADGAVSMAFRVRRGGLVSPLAVLDADALRPGIQDLLLDTLPPTISELQNGGTLTFRSDQRGLVISGAADELIQSVEVTSDIGDNLVSGALSPAIGSDITGLFVAAPVGADLLPSGEVAYEVIAYDAANNPSPSVSGFFTQHGAVGPGAFTPGDSIQVEVFDALTLEALSGALVVSHEDVGDGINFPFAFMATTDVDGAATLATNVAAGTLLTVDLAGYDLFTFQGVTSTRMSVGLYPVGFSATATATGGVTTSSPLSSLFSLNIVDIKLSDSRRPLDGLRTFDAQDCIDLFGLALTCPFGPVAILPSRFGAVTAIVGDFELTPSNYAAETLIQGFEMVVPRPQVDGGNADQYDPDIPFLFQEPDIDQTELPVDFPETTIEAAGILGLDNTLLVGDPSTTGDPEVTLESIVPGIPGAVVVGIGLAFEDIPGESWTVRAAHPGSVTAGFFAAQGIVDPDLFLRAELRDIDGNRSVRRPRQSQLSVLPTANTLDPVDVPTLLLPGSGGSSGAASFNLSFEDVLPDGLGLDGLYEVRLEDSDGRGWRLWRSDPSGPGMVTQHVPDLSMANGSELGVGSISAVIRAWAWAGFDDSAFLWSDLEREHDVFVESASVSFNLL